MNGEIGVGTDDSRMIHRMINRFESMRSISSCARQLIIEEHADRMQGFTAKEEVDAMRDPNVYPDNRSNVISFRKRVD